jgi:hypothetical protein
LLNVLGLKVGLLNLISSVKKEYQIMKTTIDEKRIVDLNKI